jgi:hypothetical protein
MYGLECNCGCLDSHKKKMNGDSIKILNMKKDKKPKQNEIFVKSKSKTKKK